MVALVVIGPKDLPKAMRFVGHWVGKARGVARQFRSGIDDMVREAELDEMEKKWADENERIMREHPPPTATRPSRQPPDPDATPSSDGRGDRRSADDSPRAVMTPLRRPTRRAGDDALADAPPPRRTRPSRAMKESTTAARRCSIIWSSCAGGCSGRRRARRCVRLCLYFARPIFAFLVQPLLRAGQGKMIYTQLFEAFFVEIKVAFFAAMMLAFPVIANQIWQFVAPGLYEKEKRRLLPFLLATPVLFLTGAALAYYVAMPVALHFLLGFRAILAASSRRRCRRSAIISISSCNSCSASASRSCCRSC